MILVANAMSTKEEKLTQRGEEKPTKKQWKT